MSAFVCAGCDINWPQSPQFTVCGSCGRPTVGVPDADPIEFYRAQSLTNALRPRLVKRRRFELMYAEREVAKLREELAHWSAKLGSPDNK